MHVILNAVKDLAAEVRSLRASFIEPQGECVRRGRFEVPICEIDRCEQSASWRKTGRGYVGSLGRRCSLGMTNRGRGK
jgi:hypothetical protein